MLEDLFDLHLLLGGVVTSQRGCLGVKKLEFSNRKFKFFHS